MYAIGLGLKNTVGSTPLCKLTKIIFVKVKRNFDGEGKR
jgi:hypothetical protein